MLARLARWSAHFGVRPTADSVQMARAGALLYAPGGVLVALTLLFPRQGMTTEVVAGVAVAATLVAAGLWWQGRRVPAQAFPALTGLGTVLISLAIRYGGIDGDAFALLFVWAVLFAFYFYRPAMAVLQAAGVGCGYLITGNLGRSPAVQWLITVVTVVVAGVWMRASVRALMTSEQTFRRLFDGNPQPMWVFDLDTLMFLAVNDAAVRHYGYSRAEFLTMHVTDIPPPEDVPAQLASIRARSDHGPRQGRHRHRDGRVMTVEVSAHDQSFQGRNACTVLVIDVSARAALEEQLRHQAFHDSLTGLANRALLRDRIDHALARRRRLGGLPLAVLIIDLDGFKAVNDTLGHNGGDEVLIEVAARLLATIRPHDTPAHIGGDEFAVLLEGSSGEQARRTGERILAALAAPFTVVGSEVFIGASIGVAECGAEDVDGDTVVRDADVAMYSAKTQGKGRVELFEPTMHRQARRRFEMTGELRAAVEHTQFVVEYQPIVAIDGGRVSGVEALVRWIHPVRGMMAPASFIPLAEETGLIIPIGRWVLEQACRQVAEWQREVPGAEHLHASVNVSARQLREPSFVAVVLETLTATALPPTSLVLEVTETVLVEDLVLTRERLETLRGHGIRIALDDFGAGYSSLGYLRGLPLDVVKIDRMFVTGLGSEQGDDREMTMAIVRLLDTLEVHTVAEGIETERELDYVRALGIDGGQGYLFCRPARADRIGELLRARPADSALTALEPESSTR